MRSTQTDLNVLFTFFHLIHFIQVYFITDHKPWSNYTTALQSGNKLIICCPTFVPPLSKSIPTHTLHIYFYQTHCFLHFLKLSAPHAEEQKCGILVFPLNPLRDGVKAKKPQNPTKMQ